MAQQPDVRHPGGQQSQHPSQGPQLQDDAGAGLGADLGAWVFFWDMVISFFTGEDRAAADSLQSLGKESETRLSSS